MTAFVKCAGTCGKAKQDYAYTGIEDCVMMAHMQNGGPKSCDYGCCGFGTCVKACPFDAIHIVDGVAVVDKEACKACGKCIKACPKNLIELVPYEAKHLVQCSSKEKGKDVMAVCSTGCIGCRMCQKVCPADAIVVENNLAWIDQRSVRTVEHVLKNVRKRSFCKRVCEKDSCTDQEGFVPVPDSIVCSSRIFSFYACRLQCGLSECLSDGISVSCLWSDTSCQAFVLRKVC